MTERDRRLEELRAETDGLTEEELLGDLHARERRGGLLLALPAVEAEGRQADMFGPQQLDIFDA